MISTTEPFIWAGILFCISQSAMFSGLNLALFGVSRLRLEVAVTRGNRAAERLLAFRRDSNYLLATILWGNVAANCLLTILSDSVMAGATAFLFSTVLITFLGEICPQAYFSRHALKVFALLAPMLRFYTILLYPIAKPVSLLLDAWLGPEGIQYYPERDLQVLIQKHMSADQTDVSRIEGTGALNFLSFDDLCVHQEGEPVDPQSVIPLALENGRPAFPEFQRNVDDPFVRRIQASAKKWVILTGPDHQPLLALDAEAFLRGLLFDGSSFNPYSYCHRPIVVTNPNQRIGEIVPQWKVTPAHSEDDVIDHDIILLWSAQKRVITGSDVLGRLLRGIVKQDQPRELQTIPSH